MNTAATITPTTPAEVSASVRIKPQDSRCKYWAKIVRANAPLPLPSAVSGASDIAGKYLQNGDEELFEGDFLFEGEARHHIKDRGWAYNMAFIHGGQLVHVQYTSERKAAMKADGLPKEFLTGAGDIAGMIRIAHAVRMGIDIGPIATSE